VPETATPTGNRRPFRMGRAWIETPGNPRLKMADDRRPFRMGRAWIETSKPLCSSQGLMRRPFRMGRAWIETLISKRIAE